MRRNCFDFVLIAIIYSMFMLAAVSCTREMPTSEAQEEDMTMSFSALQATRTVYEGTAMSNPHHVDVPELTFADMPSIVCYIRISSLPPFTWTHLPIYSDSLTCLMSFQEQRVTLVNCELYEYKIVVVK